MKRSEQLKKVADIQGKQRGRFDILIVGGGINGAVTALCLAQKGFSVVLVEAGDFAGQTSQASSNLIWGGVKYLENFELRLVQKLSKSRNRLREGYPGLVRELRFLVPHKKSNKHGLLKMYLGAWFYWIWGGMKTRVPRFHTLASLQKTGFPLNLSGLNGGFEYSDAYLIENDARFVFNFIREAETVGGVVLNYTVLKTTKQKFDKTTGTRYWENKLYDKVAKKSCTVSSRVFINAAGPYIDNIHRKNKLNTEHQHVFSKGVHLIVNRLLPDRRALAFHANDGRLFFALPMGECTCIGTTDTRVSDMKARVLEADREFILKNINVLLKLEQPLTKQDIISERCGVRPLAQPLGMGENSKGVDWFTLSRKHVIEQDNRTRHISIFGGKLTDCLNVGEKVHEVVRGWLPRRGGELNLEATRDTSEVNVKWFGEPNALQREQFLTRALQMLPKQSALLLWRRYYQHGVRMLERLEEVHHNRLNEARATKGSTQSIKRKGTKPVVKKAGKAMNWEREWKRLTAPLIAGYHVMVIEAEYCVEHELVVSVEDFLRRRTMLGLVVPQKILKTNKVLMSLRKKLMKAK